MLGGVSVVILFSFFVLVVLLFYGIVNIFVYERVHILYVVYILFGGTYEDNTVY